VGGATTPEQHDLAQIAAPQSGQRVVGNVGDRQRIWGKQQDPGDIQGDIAVADDDRSLTGQIECAGSIVGMAVVPADEVACAVASGQVLAGDPQCAVVAPTA
jgi:hypothetical protein